MWQWVGEKMTAVEIMGTGIVYFATRLPHFFVVPPMNTLVITLSTLADKLRQPRGGNDVKACDYVDLNSERIKSLETLKF